MRAAIHFLIGAAISWAIYSIIGTLPYILMGILVSAIIRARSKHNNATWVRVIGAILDVTLWPSAIITDIYNKYIEYCIIREGEFK